MIYQYHPRFPPRLKELVAEGGAKAEGRVAVL